MNCRTAILRSLAGVFLAHLLLISAAIAQTTSTAAAPKDVLIKNATLLTVTHGKIANGSVYIKDGKIAAFGDKVSAPAAWP